MGFFRKHFRNGNKYNDKHPTYVFNENGKNYDYLSLTHSVITNGTKNIELEKNPEPLKNDKSNDKLNDKLNDKSYVRNRRLKSPKSSFGSKLVGWKFDEKDKKKIDKIINPPKKHK